jgi:ribosomal protein S18 acetylase RimI-like enzyme
MFGKSAGMVTVAVRAATRADRAAVAEVLGAAFQVEPVYQWLFPDPAQRRRRLGPLLRTMVTHLHEGPGVVQVATDGEAIVGVAVWDAPGAVDPGRRRMRRALPGMLWATGRSLPRLARLGAPFAAARPSTPHWYLSHLGVVPHMQGRGVGAALMGSMPPLRDGAPAYLECKPENVAFYQRFGFDVSGEVTIDADLSVPTMWRPPGEATAR